MTCFQVIYDRCAVVLLESHALQMPVLFFHLAKGRGEKHRVAYVRCPSKEAASGDQEASSKKSKTSQDHPNNIKSITKNSNNPFYRPFIYPKNAHPPSTTGDSSACEQAVKLRRATCTSLSSAWKASMYLARVWSSPAFAHRGGVGISSRHLF